MLKILCPEPSSFSDSGLQYAASRADLFKEELTQSKFEALAPEYDAVLIRFNTKVSTCLLQSARRLTAILSPTTGLDHIDMKSAEKFSVKVFHLRGQKRFLKQISATSELTIALMLSLQRNLSSAFAATKQGIWNPGLFRGHELAGKKLGIVGCGRLGNKVARICLAFGMDVHIYDPWIKRLPSGSYRENNIQKLFSISDIVTLHVPLNTRNYHMIGEQELSLLGKESVLINTSRGAIIDEIALLKALKNKTFAGAALDVVENESLILNGKKHPLIVYSQENENLLISPHIGGATYESVEKTDRFILDRYFEYVERSGH